LKAVHHILASSAETKGAFTVDFDNVNLHRPYLEAALLGEVLEEAASV